jgi:hypothetical protein
MLSRPEVRRVQHQEAIPAPASVPERLKTRISGLLDPPRVPVSLATVPRLHIMPPHRRVPHRTTGKLLRRHWRHNSACGRYILESGNSRWMWSTTCSHSKTAISERTTQIFQRFWNTGTGRDWTSVIQGFGGILHRRMCSVVLEVAGVAGVAGELWYPIDGLRSGKGRVFVAGP